MYSFVPHDDNLIYKVPVFPLIDTESLLAEFLEIKDNSDIVRPAKVSAPGCVAYHFSHQQNHLGGIINQIKDYNIPDCLPALKKTIHQFRVYANMQIGIPSITYALLEPLSCYKWHVDENARVVIKKNNMSKKSSFDDFWTNDQGNNVVYHIPITSNDGCWFLYEHKVFHMPADGSLYKVDNHIHHTFLNSGPTPRIHILING